MRVQGIYTELPEKKAKDLMIGDVTVWNGGYTETITDIKKTKSGKSLIFDIICNCSGKRLKRTMRNERVVAIKER